MALLSIITAPDPRLKQVCQTVDQVDDEIRRLLDDMLETMYAAPGIGLAAPQVGALIRALVVDISHDDEKKAPLRMLNPELTWVSDHDASYDEGCLSLPEHYAEVIRPAEIKVTYLDAQGKKQELAADGLLATCIQHEMDHLDGILFVDHISALKRNMILRKLLKLRKSKTPQELATAG
jgi:peptide deformylase